MDEILKILERHPTWLIQAERVRDRGDSYPLDWLLRMKTVAPRNSGEVEVMVEVIVSEQCRQQAIIDTIAHELRRMEQKIERATTPTGDNQRQTQ